MNTLESGYWSSLPPPTIKRWVLFILTKQKSESGVGIAGPSIQPWSLNINVEVTGLSPVTFKPPMIIDSPRNQAP